MDESTEEVRRRADIVDVVGQYVALKPAGADRWKACCPFHDEKTPSFYVSRDKGFYKCFGCSATGDVFKFLQQSENITFPEAKKQLAERYGVALKSNRELTPEQQETYAERDRLARIMATSIEFFRTEFAGESGRPARDYARRRGLSQSTLEKFSIGYAPDSWDALQLHLVRKFGYKPADCALSGMLIEKQNDDGTLRHYDRYRHRLMFPIWDERGQVIAFGGRALEGGNTGTPEAKYINSPETPLFKKNRTLFAWHIARAEVGKRESIIVTEGYMDAIALHEGGFANTIATLGTALTIQHVAMLRRLAPKTIYLCYDGDSAGMQAALRAAPLFDANGLNVRVVTLPDAHDPDTFIREQGEVGFSNALSRARLLAQYRVEMAIEGFDFSNVGERAEAIKAASDIIATVPNETEKDAYIAWLAERWGREEGVTAAARLQMIEAAVRRQVATSSKNSRATTQSTLSQGRAPKYFGGNNQSNGQNAGEAEQELSQTLNDSAHGQLSGVAKAERLLLGSLLSSPSWRGRILEALPPALWTQEIHYAIVSALRDVPNGEPVEPSALMEKLSPEEGGLMSELLLSDDTQTAPTLEVIDDCIARVQGHWARQREREILDLVRGKLERNEAISPAERETYVQALIATKRKVVSEKAG